MRDIESWTDDDGAIGRQCGAPATAAGHALTADQRDDGYGKRRWRRDGGGPDCRGRALYRHLVLGPDRGDHRGGRGGPGGGSARARDVQTAGAADNPVPGGPVSAAVRIAHLDYKNSDAGRGDEARELRHFP